MHKLLLVIGVASIGACSPFDAEVNPEGRALTGFLTDIIDPGIQELHGLTMLIEQRDEDASDGCELVRRDGVTFAGGAMDDTNGLLMGGTQSGGVALDGLYGSSCAAMGLHADVAPRDGLTDGELIIESGGGRATWTGLELFAPRRFVPVAEMSVARGETLELRYEPASDEVWGVSASVIDETTFVSVTLEAEMGANGVVTLDIPENMSTGALTLDVATFFLIGSECEGFSSCEIEGAHTEKMPITIRP